MTGPITPASTAPSDLYIGTPCGDSPTPSYSESPGNSLSPTPGPGEAPKDGEKKPVKKRKSWGQVLPTPTTNLPPRKRAKTEPEKEQRRIERVIRNRQAAQTSRERKRLEYEALEKAKAALEVDNNELKSKLTLTERENIELAQRLSNLEQQVKMFQDTMNVARQIADKVNFSQSGVPVPTDIPSPVGSDDVPSRMSFVDNTLDPNTLFSNEASNTSSPALDINVEALYETQQTAVLLCDLPCLQRASRPSPELLTIWMMQYLLLATMTSTIYSIQMPFLQLFLSLKRGTKIPDTQLARFSPLILWLITTKPTKQLWRRLLTCNPACALLLVATDERLQSESSKLFGKFGSLSGGNDGGSGLLGGNPASELRRLVESLDLDRQCDEIDYGPVKRSATWNISRRPGSPGCGGFV
ncbi:putative bZIP transcription factor [Morchella snyderi]|nr:putative bZIP transcription factor [Morchella snyderi]